MSRDSNSNANPDSSLSAYNNLKHSFTGVVYLKGSLAVLQITTLLTLLILSLFTSSPTDPRQSQFTNHSCGRKLGSWMGITVFRLTVCWSVSLWVVCRKRTRERAPMIGRDGDTERLQSLGYSREEEGSGSDEEGKKGDGLSPFSSSSSTSVLPSTAALDGRSLTSSTPLAIKLDLLAPYLTKLLALLSLVLLPLGIYLVTLTPCRTGSPLLFSGVSVVLAIAGVLVLQVLAVLLWGSVRGFFRGEQEGEQVGRAVGPVSEEAVRRCTKVLAGLEQGGGGGREGDCSVCLSALLSNTAPDEGEHELAALQTRSDPVHHGTNPPLPLLTEAQTLRQLPCSHTFHTKCIDPWLMAVSGRCPVCNRPLPVDPTE